MHRIIAADQDRRLKQYAGTFDRNSGIAGTVGNAAQQCKPARRARITLEVTAQPGQAPADYAQALATNALAISNPVVVSAQVIS
jgi:hypothetical protein